MAIELHYTPIPFDDTYVLYNADDIFSLLSVFFTLLPIGILVFYLSWFLTTREVEPVIMAAGQVVNDIINNVAKNHIKQVRPYNFEGFQASGLRSGYGMPSAHSQFMGFFATYLILRIWIQWKGLSVLRKIISTISLGALSWCVMYSRVYLYYHSVPQVLVGLGIGTTLGLVYYFTIDVLRSIGLVDYVLSWGLADWFHVKDSCYYEPLSLREERALWLNRREITKGKKKSQ
ncbi:hypothetical protein WICPIJ_003032 [Wickerhamomyces pijperi]|uniref:Dolichyldiphosphatase n=1 Tax=Wickerhamomyces pijperi TaxID=599730 RepID=A0A9P8Q8M5_WICPI|nr:hypothetical protein WICPIJ_003032 [Wickerhamomyces pijperi]